MRAMLGRRILDGTTRYIGLQLVTTFILVSIGLTLIVWLTQTVRLLDLIVNRGLPFDTALYFLGLLLPKLISVMIPITLFISVVFVYFRLASDSELVVLVSAGLSPLQLARAGMLVALVVLVVGYWLAISLQPAAARVFSDLAFRMRNDYSQALLQEGVFSELIPGLTFYARERDGAGVLHGVLIYDRRIPKSTRIYTAASGLIAGSEEGPRVVLERGTVQQSGAGDVSILYFDRTIVELSDLTADRTAPLRSEEMTLAELLQPGPEFADRESRDRLRVQAHRRLTEPLQIFAYTMVGLACMLLGPRGRRQQRINAVVAVLAVGLLVAASYAGLSIALVHPWLVPLLYLIPLLTAAAALLLLSQRFRRHRLRPAG